MSSEAIAALARLMDDLSLRARAETIGEVSHRGQVIPLRAFVFGNRSDPSLPVFALFGGVHGLERIGSEVVLAYMRTVSEYASWDQSTADLLSRMRIVFVPVVNPVGIALNRRSNGNGVDLMRNAPIDSLLPEPAWKIFRGHRISNLLPWYRGKENSPMEAEAQALVDFVKREIFPSKLAICVDVHSGFGAIDRLWYPYATKKEKFRHSEEISRLSALLDRTLPNHVYVVEPQSRQYTTHGDLWDYLCELKASDPENDGLFLPLTLEMGSWNWLKKNFFHSLQLQALFHPLKRHRIRRVLRRHSPLFDFLARASLSSSHWL